PPPHLHSFPTRRSSDLPFQRLPYTCNAPWRAWWRSAVNNRYSKHASDEQLLRALDGELSARDLSAVQEHIEACWSYRARREQMRSEEHTSELQSRFDLV